MSYPVLGVNIDHVATVRQQREESYPSVVEAALLCEEAGIYCITAHLREDRRHIQDSDIYRLKEALSCKLNLEMSLAPDIVDIALDVKPYMVTLVPERREELTTEGGLDVVKNSERLKELIELFTRHDIIVSLFIEPNERDTKVSAELGAKYVEFHTGSYANAQSETEIQKELDRLYKAADTATICGLKVNAGHGLNYTNITPVLKMRELRELNIGHSIVSRALFVGIKQAVREMNELLSQKDV